MSARAYLKAYSRAQRATPDMRKIERDILGRITHGLEAANASADPFIKARAIGENRSLWQVFVNDLSRDNNQLPEPLRTSLLQIGRTVLNEMRVSNRDSVDLAFLIRINRSIIAGLNGIPN